jgi:hypothetical protein
MHSQGTAEWDWFKGIVSRDGVSTENIDAFSSLGLNIVSCISFTLVKSLVKTIRRFKHAVSRCKMAGTGFHSIAKLRAQTFNPVLTDRGVYSADCQNENIHTADCQSQEPKF